ncbi:hypothetical protein ANME2D_02504 [Candidatus Methanoperedens nitroreducens]|uniref:Ribonuclease R winged-helix domain-containing protein n=1 Tax=Candidatus Methanoperedens nitratireducens TaxID=1392998 RepID=A0A062V1Q6_9EURY|nr:winged-helix domain-containing protein [Candidatus Methanoperedens nitroreducens]KCZ71302.1 hypothetical protein ANME2D_02504 [Candidatus Methanoperedens nitroreducens]MDJ1423761.1 winged-helix domain-containing protein [Candidatus Methanoperedens sp.]
MYLIEYPSGKKFDLMKLDKEQLSKINETKAQILEVLADKKGLYSAKMIEKRLKERGINFRIDNIRYHLNELTEINLVDRITATKITEKLDPRAQYFYKINPEYIGFYFTYFPKEEKYIEQKIHKGRHYLVEILDYLVLNKEGDAVVSEFYIFENAKDTPVENVRHWLYRDEGFLTFNELELESFDGNGNKLKVEQIGIEGKHEVVFRIYFFKPIKKGEVYSYWFKFKANKAFPIGIQHIYRDAGRSPGRLLLICVTLQEEIKGIKKMKGLFKTEKIPEKLETPIKPFSYLENSRVKILWYIPETVFDSTYILEWEPKV